MRERSKTHQSQLFPSRSLIDISLVPRHLSACLLIFFFFPLGEKQRWVLENEAVCCHKRCPHTREGSLPASCLLWADPCFWLWFPNWKVPPAQFWVFTPMQAWWTSSWHPERLILGCSQTPRCLTNTYHVCTKVQVTCPLVTAMCTSIRTGLKMSSPSPGWWDMRVD